MSDLTPDVAIQVDRTLDSAGLPVSPEERERLIRLYPSIRQWTAALRMQQTRYAEPALIYPAETER
jgi:hypothetical protein